MKSNLHAFKSEIVRCKPFPSSPFQAALNDERWKLANDLFEQLKNEGLSSVRYAGQEISCIDLIVTKGGFRDRLYRAFKKTISQEGSQKSRKLFEQWTRWEIGGKRGAHRFSHRGAMASLQEFLDANSFEARRIFHWFEELPVFAKGNEGSESLEDALDIRFAVCERPPLMLSKANEEWDSFWQPLLSVVAVLREANIPVISFLKSSIDATFNATAVIRSEFEDRVAAVKNVLNRLPGHAQNQMQVLDAWLLTVQSASRTGKMELRYSGQLAKRLTFKGNQIEDIELAEAFKQGASDPPDIGWEMLLYYRNRRKLLWDLLDHANVTEVKRAGIRYTREDLVNTSGWKRGRIQTAFLRALRKRKHIGSARERFVTRRAIEALRKVMAWEIGGNANRELESTETYSPAAALVNLGKVLLRDPKLAVRATVRWEIETRFFIVVDDYAETNAKAQDEWREFLNPAVELMEALQEAGIEQFVGEISGRLYGVWCLFACLDFAELDDMEQGLQKELNRLDHSQEECNKLRAFVTIASEAIYERNCLRGLNFREQCSVYQKRLKIMKAKSKLD